MQPTLGDRHYQGAKLQRPEIALGKFLTLVAGLARGSLLPVWHDVMSLEATEDGEGEQKGLHLL